MLNTVMWITSGYVRYDPNEKMLWIGSDGMPVSDWVLGFFLFAMPFWAMGLAIDALMISVFVLVHCETYPAIRY